MRAVVVYESIFGNTRAVAEAIAEGLRERVEVDLRPVGEAGTDACAGADLLVVGGPTHVHGMTSERSREGAVAEARTRGLETPDLAQVGPGLRAWLDGLRRVGDAQAASFDTRMHGPKLLTGSAAGSIGRRLKADGYPLLAEPESFVVQHTEGPLGEGERERARAWGALLGARLAERRGTT
jgi:hypothetical protein